MLYYIAVLHDRVLANWTVLERNPFSAVLFLALDIAVTVPKHLCHRTLRGSGPVLGPKHSGGWKCALVGVPWQGSVSACLAWGDMSVKNMCEQVLEMLSILRPDGTPMTAHLQLPDCTLPGRLHGGAAADRAAAHRLARLQSFVDQPTSEAWFDIA